MRLGIDYGTTNTVAVLSDRGRYAVVPQVVDTSIGRIIREVFPSLIVYDREARRMLHGLEAERAMLRPGGEKRYLVIPSLKRRLRDYVDGARLDDGQGESFDILDLLRGFLEALHGSIARSGFCGDHEELEAVITWPANANGAQRYVTRRAFREAGFKVLSTLNEPSAAAVEFSDRMARGNRIEARKLAMTIGVFDLGGGTFDASLVRIDGPEFTVLGAAGIGELGGDDFDLNLAEIFCRQMKIEFDELPVWRRLLLLGRCRQLKESLSVVPAETLILNPAEIGLAGAPCMARTDDYFKALRPLILVAVRLLSSVAAKEGLGGDRRPLDAIYLVGGASRLPLVATMVQEGFPGVRHILTDKPFTSTAMGAAIQSTGEMTVSDVFSRHFGVIRLAEHGTREYFSTIFGAGTRLPRRGDSPIEHRIAYRPHHNIGHLRYLECAAIDGAGLPAGGTRPWCDILFPYDAEIPLDRLLAPEEIVPREDLSQQLVEEVYSCDADGVISVTLTRRLDGHSRSYEIFRG